VRFDPNAAALADSGIFGLPDDADARAAARVVLIPVPWDATTSYRPGTARGPDAILEASRQVDLFDGETGRPYTAGITLRPPHPDLARWNVEARAEAEKVIEAGGRVDGDATLEAALALVNARSRIVDAEVEAQVSAELDAGKIVGIVGGDHSTPLGSILAHARRWPGLGILHVDAHADLRRAYEGFERSHASIMDNVLKLAPGVAKLVQVGIRDFCEEEVDAIRDAHGRVATTFDVDVAAARMSGALPALFERIVAALPTHVYVSFDIDGLDPTLCPHTGTPVPGGLSFHEASLLVGLVARSGRTIVGFDLNEVAPGPEGDEWDANVGARLLYKLIGWTLVSRGLSTPVALPR
jgi:agmatinase